MALACVLNHGDDIFPIPGARKISRLKENLAALEVNFSDAELAKIIENCSYELVMSPVNNAG